MDQQTPFRASDYDDSRPHLLLACTGSVATIKLPDILHALSTCDISIIVLLTPHAARFLTQDQTHTQQPTSPPTPSRAIDQNVNEPQFSTHPQPQSQPGATPDQFASLRYPNVQHIFTDTSEWDPPWHRASPILHIELRRWADLYLIAPLSANSLSKLTSGVSDSLVLSVARAWDTDGTIDLTGPAKAHLRRNGNKVVVVAPAMNTAMWKHPVTATQMGVLRAWDVENGGWVQVLEPVEKELACGDTGIGAMRDWREVVGVVKTRLGID